MTDIPNTIYPVQRHPLAVGEQQIPVLETGDFPFDDPWSTLTRQVVSGLREEGAFDGQDFLEAGIGDGRNTILAADLGEGGAQTLTGIELDNWRLDLARHNLSLVGLDSGRLALHRGDIVEWLESGDQPIEGWSLACLPQAPGFAAENDADGYDEEAGSLERFHGMELGEYDVDTYGLTLNAAYLAALRSRIASGNFNALLTLSDRVPSGVLEELFTKTGWKIAETYAADEPVQQDPDTSVGWTIIFDDGERFRERDVNGDFVPLRALVAETRRRSGLLVHGDHARDDLNVYHGLSVYRLHPDTSEVEHAGS